MSVTGKPRRLIVAALVCLTLAGCIGLVPSPFRPSPGPQKSPDNYDLAQAFDMVCRNYRVGPDDQLRVLYQTEWTIPQGSYQLDTLDEIDIEFILDPALNRKVSIRPDGMITLPGVGDVRAAGLTPEGLAKRIEDKYLETNIFTKEEARGELKNYKMVTVNVVSFYQKVKKLVESLTTLTGGQQTTILVNPDGTVDLPLLPERILAAGHTVREVESTINKRYTAGPLKHVIVSLSLLQAQSRKVYVLGDVQRPGAYDLKQPITALQAIALAGGPISDTADLTSVILISKDIYGKPIGRRLDLKRTLDVGDMASAILVKPYDVIFVPKTYIADVQLFMRQYVSVVAQIGSLVNLLKNPGVTVTGFGP
jgi:protein involved in polysaccharide export with SLBB domain